MALAVGILARNAHNYAKAQVSKTSTSADIMSIRQSSRRKLLDKLPA